MTYGVFDYVMASIDSGTAALMGRYQRRDEAGAAAAASAAASAAAADNAGVQDESMSEEQARTQLANEACTEAFDRGLESDEISDFCEKFHDAVIDKGVETKEVFMARCFGEGGGEQRGDAGASAAAEVQPQRCKMTIEQIHHHQLTMKTIHRQQKTMLAMKLVHRERVKM